jgi:AcrR family transcriptional regulator
MKTGKRRYTMTARAAKAEATQQRIRESAARLYCAGPIEAFTLDKVAAQAGTTVQTVLRIFGSKDLLLLAALNDLASVGVPLRPTPPGDVGAAVAAIFDLYEEIGDLVIRRLCDEHRHRELKPALDAGREHHRQWVHLAFAPQLARREGEARTRLSHALVAATDAYVWQVLRRHEGLSRAMAEAIVRDMILGLTEREDGNGSHPVAELVGRRESAP